MQRKDVIIEETQRELLATLVDAFDEVYSVGNEEIRDMLFKTQTKIIEAREIIARLEGIDYQEIKLPWYPGSQKPFASTEIPSRSGKTT